MGYDCPTLAVTLEAAPNPEAPVKRILLCLVPLLLWTTPAVHAEAVPALSAFELLLDGADPLEAAEAPVAAGDAAGWEARGWARLLLGEDRAALEAFRAALEADPAGLRGEALIRDLLRYVDYSGDFAAVEGVLAELTAGDDLTPGARRAANRWLAFLARRRGDESELAERRRAVGLLTDWSVVGPFVRSGPLDIDWEFPPERRLRDAYELPVLGETRWTTPPAGDSRGFIPLEEVTAISRGTAYALCYVYLPRDGEYNLNLVADDACKIWVDETLVGVRDDIRSAAPVEIDFPFSTPAGWHRIMVKCRRHNYLSSSQVEVAWGFKLELTGADGRAVDGLEVSTDRDLERETENGVAVPPHNEELPADDAGLFHRAVIAAHREDYDGALGLLDELQQRRPDAELIRLLTGWVLEADGSEERAGRARTQYQRVVAAEPAILPAQLALAETEADEGRYWSALARLQSLIQTNPDSPDLWLALAYRYNQKGVTPREDEAFAAALTAAPDNLEALLQRARFLDRNERPLEALEVLERLLELAPDHSTARSDLADLLQEIGDYRGAAEHYRLLIAADPYDVNARLELARCYLKGGFGDREAVYRELIEAAPHDYRGYLNLGLALEAQGGEAAELLTEALEKYPAKDWLRRYLAWRSAELDDEFQPTVEELLASAPEPADYPKSDAVMLFDYLRMDVNADYTYATTLRQVVKILAPTGLERWGEVVVPDSGDLELIHARTYTPDGRTLEATTINTTDGGRAVSMEGVRVGAIIDVCYRQHSEYRIITELFDHWTSRFYFREYGDPLVLSRFVVSAPDVLEVEYDERGFNGDSYRVRLPDGLSSAGDAPYQLEPRTAYVHEVRDAPAIQSEGLMPERGTFTPFVVFSTLEEPAVYFDWYHGRALEALRPDEPVRELARRLTAGVDDPRTRAERLYSYVVREIKGYGGGAFYPDGVRRTYYRRAGRDVERLLLFIALCREVGLEAELCLTRSRWDGPRMDDAFTPAEFTKPIARLELPDGVEWIEFGAGRVALGEFGLQHEGQPVRRLDAGRWDRLPERPLEHHLNEIHVEIDLQPGGTSRGVLEERLLGLTAALRVNYLDARDARDTLDYELNNFFPGATLVDYELRGVEEPNAELGYRVVFNAAGLGGFEGSRYNLPVVLQPFNLANNFINRNERHYDLAYADYLSQSSTVVFRLPPGWTVEESSLVDEELQALAASYELRTETRDGDDGRELVINRRLLLPPQHVETDDYLEFREFCRAVDELERLRVTLVPTE